MVSSKLAANTHTESHRYRDEEELVTGGRMRISHEYGHVALHIFYTHPEDEGRYVCRATNELGEDQTEANLICRPLPHLQ